MQGTNIPGSDSAPSIDYWQVVKNRYGVILLTFLLVFMTAAVITSVMPPKYESTSVVQVHPSMITISPIGQSGQSGLGTLMTRNYMENEFEWINAPETLTEAAERLDLPARWTMDLEDVVKTLRGIVATNPRRGTDFIEITVRHSKPEEAKEIAEAISAAYVARRNREELERAESALVALDDELTLQGDFVQEHRKELTVLIQQYGIPYFDGRSASPVGVTEEEMYRLSQKKLDDYETQRVQLTIQIQKLMTTPNEDIVRAAAGLDLPENQVTTYYNQNRQAIDQYNAIQAQGLGPKHPEVIAMKQLADSALEYARNEVVTLK